VGSGKGASVGPEKELGWNTGKEIREDLEGGASG